MSISGTLPKTKSPISCWVPPSSVPSMCTFCSHPQNLHSLPHRAYRFPTDNCPGFYGFAFLKGLPYTQSQVDQKPRATPTLHSQCLANLISPTSTPTPTAIASTSGSGGTAKTGSYWVYNRYDDGQVPLLGIDELPRGIWNSSWLGK